MTYNEVTPIELPKIKDLRGNLSFLEEHNHVPFKINRTYWIYDVPGGEERGGHAFKNTTEFIVPLSGGFSVEVINGEEKQTFELNKTNCGILIPKLTWRKITNFLSNSVCLIVADTKFEDCQYIRDYNDYIKTYNELK
ncbi:WxcM-like domain-containing protein [Labilibacter sediminis]|nr:WxcM-like domain-containing protein [Labilibacter sediminis]